MRSITYISPYYLNPDMLKVHLRTWERYPPEILAHYLFIIVDDCSPQSPAAPLVLANAAEAIRPRIQVYRVLVDIPWNQHGARNLGAKVAPDGWLMMTDMDHQLMAEDAGQLLAVPLDEKRFYYLRRIKAGRITETERHHCNSFVTTRKAYWECGGYDEDFCGSYGGDGQFIAALSRVVQPEKLDRVSLVRYPRDVIADASTTTLERAGPHRDEYQRRASRRRGVYKAERPIRFQWERVL